MHIIGDLLIMADGRTYSANRGIIGLGPDLELSEGYDGGFDYDMLDVHRVEIAEYMIALWTRVKNGEKPPEEWR